MCTKLLAVKLRVELLAMEPKLSCDGGDDGDDGGADSGADGDAVAHLPVLSRALTHTAKHLSHGRGKACEDLTPP
jgi:hypothetical protein